MQRVDNGTGGSSNVNSVTRCPLPAEFVGENARIIGCKVRVVCCTDESFEGFVFSFDPVANFLILEDRNDESPSKSKTRILQLEALKQIEVVEKAPEDADAASSLPAISDEDLLRMEQRNKAIAERALASIGKDVSSEAQAIFDALNKTMPCEWEDKNIRVMGDVVIKPPYQVQNCSSANGPVLNRVKKVLEGELNKLRRAKR